MEHFDHGQFEIKTFHIYTRPRNCRLIFVLVTDILCMISCWRLRQRVLRGYCTSYPQISMFCVLSQNYQRQFEK